MEYDFPHISNLRRGATRLEERYDQVLLELSTRKDQIGFLERAKTWEDDDLSDIAKALSGMEPYDIVQHFDPEVLVWATVNASFHNDADRLRAGLEDLLEIDQDLFERARLWQWQNEGNRDFSAINSNYNLFSNLQIGLLEQVDLPNHLSQSALPNVAISSARASDYELAPLRVKRDESAFASPYGWEETWGGAIDDKLYSMYLDTPAGFALMYKQTPQAIVALTTEADDALAIHQLQGVRGVKFDPNWPCGERITGKVSARGLAVVDWQNLMVGIAQEIAQMEDKSMLLIKPAEKNKWTKITTSEGEPHMTKKQAKRAYDDTARRLGFIRNHNNDWARPVPA